MLLKAIEKFDESTKTLWVAFRGTDDLNDVLSDMDIQLANDKSFPISIFREKWLKLLYYDVN